jgi:hypothetical protein
VVVATLSLFAEAATGVSHPEYNHLPTAQLAGIRWSVQVRAAQNNRLGPAAELYRAGADGLGTAFARQLHRRMNEG